MEFLAAACPKIDNSAPSFMTLITFIMKIGKACQKQSGY